MGVIVFGPGTWLTHLCLLTRVAGSPHRNFQQQVQQQLVVMGSTTATTVATERLALFRNSAKSTAAPRPLGAERHWWSATLPNSPLALWMTDKHSTGKKDITNSIITSSRFRSNQHGVWARWSLRGPLTHAVTVQTHF